MWLVINLIWNLTLLALIVGLAVMLGAAVSRCARLERADRLHLALEDAAQADRGMSRLLRDIQTMDDLTQDPEMQSVSPIEDWGD